MQQRLNLQNDIDLVTYGNEFCLDSLKKVPKIAGAETVYGIENLRKLYQV